MKKFCSFVFLFALAVLFSLPASAETMAASSVPGVASPAALSAGSNVDQVHHRHRRHRHRRHFLRSTADQFTNQRWNGEPDGSHSGVFFWILAT